jgi:hypothetical protein
MYSVDFAGHGHTSGAAIHDYCSSQINMPTYDTVEVCRHVDEGQLEVPFLDLLPRFDRLAGGFLVVIKPSHPTRKS